MNRRNFLRGALSAPLTPLVTPLALALPEPMDELDKAIAGMAESKPGTVGWVLAHWDDIIEDALLEGLEQREQERRKS